MSYDASPVGEPVERLAAGIEAACRDTVFQPNVALMHLIAAARDSKEIDAAIADVRQRLGRKDAVVVGRLASLHELWRESPSAWELVKRILAEVEKEDSGEDAQPRPERWAGVFDRASAISPDAAAALYLLGRDDLAEAATRSIVDHLCGWGVLRSGARVLDLGCGAGRLCAALAPVARTVTGIDVSAGMLAAARKRCAGLANVELRKTSGRDLSGLTCDSFDLIVASDVFPYLVAAGEDVVLRHLEEARRVLTGGGALAILNYSYRGDRARDTEDLNCLAARAGLSRRRVESNGLALWDAQIHVLEKTG